MIPITSKDARAIYLSSTCHVNIENVAPSTPLPKYVASSNPFNLSTCNP